MSFSGEMIRSELASDKLEWSFGRIYEGAGPSDEDVLYEMLDSIDGVKRGDQEFLLCIDGETLDVTKEATGTSLEALKEVIKNRFNP